MAKFNIKKLGIAKMSDKPKSTLLKNLVRDVVSKKKGVKVAKVPTMKGKQAPKDAKSMVRNIKTAKRRFGRFS